MISISFIAPYPDIKNVVKEAFEQHPERSEINYRIIVKTFEEIDKKDLLADVVIARGYSANLLKDLSVPVINMTVTGFDITVALSKCIQKHRPKRIAVVGPLNVVYGVEEIKDIFDCQLSTIQVDDPSLVETEILRFGPTKDDAIISGNTGYLVCQKNNLNCVMIGSGRRSVYQAIDEAVRSIRILRQERARSDRFESIMNYTFEGIITTDNDGYVLTLNNYAKTLFESFKRDKESIHIASLLPQIDLNATVSRKTRILEELVPIQDRMHMVNCVPAGDSGAVITFANVTKIQELEGEIRKKMHLKGLAAKYSFRDILGKAQSLLDTVETARKFSKVDFNIYIFGETGTGKELFAQSIHNESPRRSNPFVAINCAALPEELLESELFGYAEGAFTGASKGGKPGLFELAHNGTIFLDEIGDISPKLQSRLLRVIQEREIMRIGHDRLIPVNIRIISASNKDLKELVAKGKFREDLLYRLNVLKIELPALRFRRVDIPILCEHFFSLNRASTNSQLRGIYEEALPLVTEYNWPGNVRELFNFCERLSVLCSAEFAGCDAVTKCLEPSFDTSIPARRGAWEKEQIRDALNRAGSKKEAARLLQMDASTLWRKMKKLKL